MTEPEQVSHQLDRDRAVVARALDGRLTAAYQPIVDLHRNAVAGYEALLRYRSEHTAATGGAPLFSATALLDSARRVGRLAEVESAALQAALRARDDLPVSCFLSLNISLGALTDERVTRVLRAEGSLDGVVLELAALGEPVGDVHDELEALRDRGAAVAVADTVLDPASLTTLLALEPGFFKLDRRLVGGIATDRAKLAVVGSLRHLAEQLGVGVIAQGIEDLADLRSLERLGISLGQGYLLARPSTTERFRTVLPLLSGSAHTGTDGERHIGPLIEPVCELTEEELDTPLPTDRSGVEFEVLVTELREPLALLRRVGRRVECLTLTTVAEQSTVPDAAKVAMRRAADARFHPLVCVDALGGCAGVVRIDRLIDVLAAGGQAASRPHQGGRTRGRHLRLR